MLKLALCSIGLKVVVVLPGCRYSFITIRCLPDFGGMAGPMYLMISVALGKSKSFDLRGIPYFRWNSSCQARGSKKGHAMFPTPQWSHSRHFGRCRDGASISTISMVNHGGCSPSHHSTCFPCFDVSHTRGTACMMCMAVSMVLPHRGDMNTRAVSMNSISRPPLLRYDSCKSLRSSGPNNNVSVGMVHSYSGMPTNLMTRWLLAGVRTLRSEPLSLISLLLL
mmetsp:Transcript_13204/g.48121  ORF Transcript_13204/g.48121 Transcript_13204/m.48121 type:complete len:223 (-) Transcript_13204:256-924(-)